MNAGVRCLNLFSRLSSYWRWCGRGPKFIARWRAGTRPSSTTETNESKPSGKKAGASFFLRGFFLCLGMAAWMANRDPAATTPDERVARLTAIGWRPVESLPCPDLRPGSYYELSGEDGAAELFAAPDGRLLSSNAPWPEEPRECREIPQPSHVEEL
jgi:hypothetical protein